MTAGELERRISADRKTPYIKQTYRVPAKLDLPFDKYTAYANTPDRRFGSAPDSGTQMHPVRL